jgi:hypothetical protein
MRPRAWIYTVIGALALGAGICLGLNVWFDIYGLFRNPHGRLLPAYGDERIAKYLLNEHYVPANFDGLLLGPSITANWYTKRFENFRIYNESLNGGNIVEEKSVVDQALPSHKMRIALMLVHPSLTLSHDFQTVPLTPRENLAALGSQSLLDAYKDVVLQRRHASVETDGFGTEYFGDPKVLNPINVRLMQPGTDYFDVDPIALKTYSDLLQEFCAYHVQTVLIVPPLAESLYGPKKTAFKNYLELIRSHAPEQMNLIDFTSDEYEAFRRDRANFSDGIHLTRLGADRTTDEVNRRLKEMRVTGSLAGLARPTQQ